MSKVSQAVGTRFEDFLQAIFPGLVKVEDSKNIIPDFYHEEGKFWVEAKAGFQDYGIRPHKYQILNFNSSDPIIYAIGFHDLPDVMDELRGLKTINGMVRKLERKMRFPYIYFVTNEVVKHIWAAEKRVNKKGTMEYCVIKQRFLESIIKDKSFNREGKIFGPEEYYCLSRRSLILRSPNEDKPGMILDREKDLEPFCFLPQ